MLPRFPYTSLRLPDVYGVYDNLGGFFESFVDPILAGRPVATLVPPERVRPRGQPAGAAPKMSWVYAPDVVDAVLAAHAAGAAAHGEIFHVAHVARVTVADMAEVVAKVANATAVLDETAVASMPQHDVGPVAVHKALLALDWRPTPLRDAVRAVVAWYANDAAAREYHVAVRRRSREPATPPLDADAGLAAKLAAMEQRRREL